MLGNSLNMTEKKTQTEELLEKISKTEELLEKISKNLDSNKGIETDIERELQIDLAKLQADSARMTEQKVNETKPGETKSKKTTKMSVAVALGIICILLIASLGGVMAYYTLKLGDKDNQINSANNTINQLNAAIADQNATIADRNNTIVSLNANITNLSNEENQLQTWLNGNETLLLAENITSYQAQISSLNAQITQLNIWLSGNVTAYQNELIQYTIEVNKYNSYVADHSHTDEDYDAISTQNTNLTNQVNDLNSILTLENSTIWINNQTISQPAGQYNNWPESANYAGYVSVNVTSTSNTTFVEVMYSAYGINYDNTTTVGLSGTAFFPLLPSNITVFIGNGNQGNEGRANETVTITYFY